MRIEIAKLHRRLKTTMIYVTHDQVEAMTMADKIVVLNGGRTEQIGAPLELYHHPRNLFVATFIGSPQMNLLAGTLLSAEAQHAHVRLAGGEEVFVAVDASGASPGEAVTLGVRPEHLVEATANGGDGGVTGKVLVVERLGECTLAYLQVDGVEDNVVAKLPGDATVEAGGSLRIGVNRSACHLFDSKGEAFRRVPASKTSGPRAALG
ncbi:TOBE domain-containing protein [Alkalilimnicola ehrlichii]|nr:TOBE domain-containing protein [Alkalilimnicola ehrlichii]